ncbi:MAG: DUF1565 domain-containing protein [Phycisphaera sp.]|nr:DUF1565 domain-containing protein [Phycisphaera sp.]
MMIKATTSLLSAALMVFAMTNVGLCSDYFVAPNGSDENAGTQAAPFKTIQKAASIMQPGDRCLIREGTYRETVTPAHSGKDNAPITFEAFKDEKVTVSGADVITGPWKAYKADIVTAPMPWTLGPGRDMVFVNGKVVIQGRQPNTHTAANRVGNRQAAPFNPPDIDLPPMWMTLGDFVVTLNSPDITSTSDLNQDQEDYWKGALYVGWHEWGWCTQSAEVESSRKGVITVKNKTEQWWHPDFAPRYRFNHHVGYLTGHLNAVDVPGEWHNQDGQLYLIPPDGLDPSKNVVEAKKRQLAFDLTDRDFIVLKGLRIFASSVTMNNANNCVIDSCRMSFVSHYTTFQDAGNGYIDGDWGYGRLKKDQSVREEPGPPQRGEVGVYVGGKDNVIKNSVIKYSAGAGVFLAGLRTTVTNNIIHDCGYAGTYVGCVYITLEPWTRDPEQKGVRGGHKVTYNEIYNTSRALITFGTFTAKPPTSYDAMEVKYNRLHNAGITASDTGAIYSFGASMGTEEQRTQVSHNLIFDSFSPSWVGLCYPDNYSFNIDYHDNVLWLSSRSRKPRGFEFLKSNQPNNAKYFNNTEMKTPYDGGVDGLKDSDYPGGKMFRTGPTIKDEPDAWHPYPWHQQR